MRITRLLYIGNADTKNDHTSRSAGVDIAGILEKAIRILTQKSETTEAFRESLDACQ
jgi:hypothetical protein